MKARAERLPEAAPKLSTWLKMQLWGGAFPHTLGEDKGSPPCSLPTPASRRRRDYLMYGKPSVRFTALLTTASENLGAGRQGETRACHDPFCFQHKPGLLAPSLSGPGDQCPAPPPDPGVQAPSPSCLRPGGPDPQPLLPQTQGSRPPAPPPDPGPDLGVLAPSPSTRPWSRPGDLAPSPNSRPWSRPGGPDPQPLLPQTRGPGPQPFLAQTQACLLPLTLTRSIPWWYSGWESACPCRGRRFHLWSQQIPHAAGDKTHVCATTPEPAATTVAQAPRAGALQSEQPP